jgi:hypothetical protein
VRSILGSVRVIWPEGHVFWVFRYEINRYFHDTWQGLFVTLFYFDFSNDIRS